MKVSDYKNKNNGVSWVGGIIIIFISIIASYAFWQYLGSDLFKRASLKIDTIYSEAIVLVDSKEEGKTPTVVRNITQGDHLVELRKPSSFYAPWSQRVSFTSGLETYINRQIGPTSYFSAGEIVYFEIEKTGLSLISTPDEVNILIDGEEMGITPLFLPNITEGVHEVVFLKEGYEGKKMELKIKSGYVVYASVDLFPIPISVTDEMIRQSDINDYPSTTLITREDWEVDDALGNYSGDEYTPVTKMTLHDLSTEDAKLYGNVKDWIQGIYYYSIMYLELSDLDWHFFIDREGNVYEGKKGGEEIVLPGGSKGIVRVGYLGKKGEGLTTDAEIAYANLEKGINGEKKYKAEIIESPQNKDNLDEPISFEARETRLVSVAYKNIGNTTWYDIAPKQVYVGIESDSSTFFTADDWLDNRKVKLLPVSYVGKNQEVRIEFKVTGPNEDGLHAEKFFLFVDKNGEVNKIEGSEFTIKLNITGGAQDMILIKNTGTGYLNVRDKSGFSGGIIDRVTPGEKYLFVEEKGDWVKIKLPAGGEGWVSKQYTEKTQ